MEDPDFPLMGINEKFSCKFGSFNLIWYPENHYSKSCSSRHSEAVKFIPLWRVAEVLGPRKHGDKVQSASIFLRLFAGNDLCSKFN